MLEVELKAPLHRHATKALAAALAGMGFLGAGREEERDIYFSTAGAPLPGVDCALRLRAVRNPETGETSSLITYKGPKRDARSNTREELETAVGDIETATAILDRLGYRPLAAVCKVRRFLCRDNITACLDEVEELGPFLELEMLVQRADLRDSAVDALLSLLDELGIPREDLLRSSYLEMLLQKKS